MHRADGRRRVPANLGRGQCRAVGVAPRVSWTGRGAGNAGLAPYEGGAEPPAIDPILAGLKAALASGIAEHRFWGLTPYQTRLAVEQRGADARAQYRLAMWTAWHAAAFERSKQLPKLEDILKRLDGAPAKRMTGEEMLRAVEALNTAAGGKDLRDNGGSGRQPEN